MTRFSERALADVGSGGGVLAAARTARRLSVAEVSRVLKLPRQHIETIEASNWYDLPAGNYGRYFIRSYAQFLGLDPAPLLARYGELTQAAPEPMRLRAVVPQQKLDRPLTHPLRRWFLGVAVAGLVVYLGFAAWYTFLPPRLTLVNLGDDATTQSSNLSVRGLTEPGARVTINAEPVQVSERGDFSATLALTPGLNTITVVAQKSYSRPQVLRRQVLFTPPADSVGVAPNFLIP